MFFENLKNHHGNTIYIYIYIYINSYTFKIAVTKFSWKFTMFQESFYMFKALKKNMWTRGFLVLKFFFPYQIFKLFQFFVNFNMFHKNGSMCSKNSKNKNTYIILDFNTRMSFYIIMVLNFMIENKLIDLTIM